MILDDLGWSWMILDDLGWSWDDVGWSWMTLDDLGWPWIILVPHQKTGNRKCLFDCPHMCSPPLHFCWRMLHRSKHKFGHYAHRILCKESNYFNCWKLPICNEQRDGKDCRKGPGEDEQESQAPPAYYHSEIIALSFRTTLWSNPAPPNQRVQLLELCHPKVHIRMCTVSLFSFSKSCYNALSGQRHFNFCSVFVRFVVLPSQKWRIALAPNN